MDAGLRDQFFFKDFSLNFSSPSWFSQEDGPLDSTVSALVDGRSALAAFIEEFEDSYRENLAQL